MTPHRSSQSLGNPNKLSPLKNPLKSVTRRRNHHQTACFSTDSRRRGQIHPRQPLCNHPSPFSHCWPVLFFLFRVPLPFDMPPLQLPSNQRKCRRQRFSSSGQSFLILPLRSITAVTLYKTQLNGILITQIDHLFAKNPVKYHRISRQKIYIRWSSLFFPIFHFELLVFLVNLCSN